MNLSDEDRKIGVANFHAAVGSKYTHRNLLVDTLDKLSFGKPRGVNYFGYGETFEFKINIGIIGTGDEGGVLIGALNPKRVEVVAIADIRPFNIYRAFHGDNSSANAKRVRPGLIKKFGEENGWATEEDARGGIKVYTDTYERMLENPEIDAVIIALPLHLHREVAIKAMQAGKHVLCEKLMAHSVAECKDMARVASHESRVLSVGHQRHYSVLYHHAADLIKRGVIGDVHHIRAQWHRGNLPGNDSWQPPLPDKKMQRQLENTKKGLKAAEGRYKKDAKKDVKVVEKFKGELASKPREIDNLKKQIEEEKPDEKKEKELRDKIKKLEIRIKAVKKTLPRKEKRLANLRKKHKLDQFAEKIEYLTHRLKDAGVNAAAYYYQKHKLGDKSVSELAELIRWRLWNRTGGGLMVELGSHQLDASGIFISALRDDGVKVKPLSVAAAGGRHLFPYDRDIDDHVYCTFEYPAPDYDEKMHPEKKIVVTYSSINGNGFGGYGETVLGTDGTLILEKEEAVMIFAQGNISQPTMVGKRKGVKEAKKKDAAGKKKKPPLQLFAVKDDKRKKKTCAADENIGKKGLAGKISRGYAEEIEHWAWAVWIANSGDLGTAAEKSEAKKKEEESPVRCGPEVALADAVIVLTANRSIQHKTRIEYKKEWFDYSDDATPDGTKPVIPADRKKYEASKPGNATKPKPAEKTETESDAKTEEKIEPTEEAKTEAKTDTKKEAAAPAAKKVETKDKKADKKESKKEAKAKDKKDAEKDAEKDAKKDAKKAGKKADK